MLGTIAKKLRMFGFDCRYYNTIDDDDIILMAKKETLVIITKDARLATNAMQNNIVTIQIHANTEKEQLVEIANGISCKKFTLAYSRCSLCNGTLEEIPKYTIIEKIPPKISESIERFWKCRECDHIYWVGTHIRNMEKLVAEINASI